MIIVIDKPEENIPEYSAWAVDCPNGVILGTGMTIEEAKADFRNSLEELRDAFDSDDWREYLKEDMFFYLRID